MSPETRTMLASKSSTVVQQKLEWPHDVLPESFGGRALPFRAGMDVNLHRKTDLAMTASHSIMKYHGIGPNERIILFCQLTLFDLIN